MKMILNFFLVLTIAFCVSAECGCLKCSKHLFVASPPHAPCKIIYRGNPGSRGYCQPLPYTVQMPVIPPPIPCIPKEYDYKITGFPLQMEDCPLCAYEYQVQAPIIPPPMPPTYLTGLVAKPDRIVLPAPKECLPNDQERICNPVFPQPMQYQMMRQVPQTRPIIEKLNPNSFYCDSRYGNKRKRRTKRDLPILKNSVGFFMRLLPDFIKFPLQQTLKTWKYHQKIVDNQERRRFSKNDPYQPYHQKYHPLNYNQKYHHYNGIKSSYLPDNYLSNGREFRMVPGLSQRFGDSTTRFKSKGTLLQKLKSINEERDKRSLDDEPEKSTSFEVPKFHRRNDSEAYRYLKIFGNEPKISQKKTKIEGSTGRLKRSTVFDGGELHLPFFRVTDIENSSESDENISEIESEESGTVEDFRNRENDFLQPLNFDQLIPHNPLFYLLNTPIRLLHHFHRLGRQISPVFKSVPQVLVSSKKYLRDFKRCFKNDVLDITSNLIGDFDDFGTTPKWPKPFRYRRSLSETKRDDKIVSVLVEKAKKSSQFEITGVVPQNGSTIGDVVSKFEKLETSFGTQNNLTNNSLVVQVVPNFFEKLETSFGTENNLTNNSLVSGANEVVPNFSFRNFGNDVENASEILNSVKSDNTGNSNGTRVVLGGKMPKSFEPEYSLVFGSTESVKRKKRYILKVVDEDEVQEFLREKLGGIAVDKSKKSKSASTKRKFVVEKLSPKIIIDNNGRSFVEINGVKRPLFRNRKPPNEGVEGPKNGGEIEENMKEKIDNLIEKAKERVEKDEGGGSLPQNDVSIQVVKDRVNQIIGEIQDLINMDFGRYSNVYSGLCKLQNFKNFVVDDWKKVLIEEKSDEMVSKIRILDNFREMQTLKDDNVKNIAAILNHGNSFMTKKLIKMLVRLQKLQCIIVRVVEDFGEKIKMGTKFDIRKEIKYVEFLSNLNFIVGRTERDFEEDLKIERDSTVETELKLLEKFRKFSQNPHENHEQTKLLWEIGNIEKLQKETINEMNTKIGQNQKIRKELKILFDLLRQLENCEEKQKNLIEKPQRPHHRQRRIDEPTEKRGFSHTYLEDKKPVKLVSNGYTLHAYKITD